MIRPGEWSLGLYNDCSKDNGCTKTRRLRRDSFVGYTVRLRGEAGVTRPVSIVRTVLIKSLFFSNPIALKMICILAHKNIVYTPAEAIRPVCNLAVSVISSRRCPFNAILLNCFVHFTNRYFYNSYVLSNSSSEYDDGSGYTTIHYKPKIAKLSVHFFIA